MREIKSEEGLGIVRFWHIKTHGFYPQLFHGGSGLAEMKSHQRGNFPSDFLILIT